MAIHIIIDGYNLIRQSETLKDLEYIDLQLGRETLIDQLASYRRMKHHHITVVFDGTNAPVFSQKRDIVQGIHVVFSRNGELADTVIKRMVGKEREKALVVTSDREITCYALSKEASVIESADFEAKITINDDAWGYPGDDHRDDGWKPSTKKRGPSRRLPKRKRRSMAKIRKL